MRARWQKAPVIPDPPRKPEPYECCQRGCDPCIFDYYDAALERWSAKVREAGLDPADLLPPA